MSADLAFDANGNAMIASFKAVPWHGQGTVFDHKVTDSSEMLRLAHCDFDVLTEPVRLFGEEVGTHKVAYRSDTRQALGVVGEGFSILQNADAFALLNKLAGDGEIQFETAGALGNGQTVWAQALIPDLTFSIRGDDVKTHMTVLNGHDGNTALKVMPVTTRIVCANTLACAQHEHKEARKGNRSSNVKVGYTIKHTSHMEDRIHAMVQAYNALREDTLFVKGCMDYLAGESFTSKQKQEFFGFVVDPTKDESAKAKELSDRAKTVRANKLSLLEQALEHETNQTEATKGTWFGLLNAATFYFDHLAQVRNRGGEDDNRSDDALRFESSQFGSGATMKQAAFGKAMEMVSA